MLAAIFGRFVTSESIINLDARFMSICISCIKKTKEKKEKKSVPGFQAG